MSEISRELLEQQGNMGAVMRKLFPEAAAIDAEEERKKLEAADARAKAILAHVRELGDDY
jgi:hypothetical protein